MRHEAIYFIVSKVSRHWLWYYIWQQSHLTLSYFCVLVCVNIYTLCAYNMLH